MLSHHDGRPYEEAASEAAKRARALMEQKLEKGAAATQLIVDQIEQNVPVDVVVRSRGLKFEPCQAGKDKQSIVLTWQQDGEEKLRDIHPHALGQIREKLHAPGTEYLDYLVGTARANLAADILNRHMAHEGQGKSYLTRSLSNQVRGFLSDRFNPYDSRAIAHAFIDQVQKVGCVMTDGIVSDIRHNMKAFFPMVFEPIPNEVMCLGVSLTNGDYGDSSFRISLLLWRLWCTNYAVTETGLTKNHIGARLPEGIVVTKRLNELSTKLVIETMGASIKALTDHKKVDSLFDAIRANADKEIDWNHARRMLQPHMRKAAVEAAEKIWNDTDDAVAVQVPPRKTVYKVSQILAWNARQEKDAERRINLEEASGAILSGAAA